MPPIVNRLSFLYIPDNAADPIREVEINSGPNFGIDMRHYLDCPMEEAETLYSEDLLSRFRGQENGIPIDQTFDVYHAYMDENANTTRPHNTRADNLLYRRGLHGPVLVSKTTCVNTATGKTTPIEFHRVTEEELRTPDFRDRIATFNREKQERN